MRIDPSHFPASHPDRDLQCQENIEPAMQEIIARANESGWGTVETMNAMEENLQNLRLAYSEDPDPEEDPIETEPANEWPAAT
jgi:hypothetical protein